MKNSFFISLMFLTTVFFAYLPEMHGKTIHNKRFKFSVEIPAPMVEIIDTNNLLEFEGDLFCDTVVDMVLLITKTESKFKSVKDYINCEQSKLENELQYNYADSTLRLLSCVAFPKYKNEVTILNIELGVLPFSYDQSIIYFIHHKGKDVQFSFLFKRKHFKQCSKKIDEIIGTLSLL